MIARLVVTEEPGSRTRSAQGQQEAAPPGE